MRSQEKTAKNIIDVVSEMEHAHCMLHHARNMLSIYEERLADELRILEDNRNLVDHFLRRYDTLQSQIDVIQMILNEAVADLGTQINNGYSLAHGGGEK